MIDICFQITVIQSFIFSLIGHLDYISYYINHKLKKGYSVQQYDTWGLDLLMHFYHFCCNIRENSFEMGK